MKRLYYSCNLYSKWYVKRVFPFIFITFCSYCWMRSVTMEKLITYFVNFSYVIRWSDFSHLPFIYIYINVCIFMDIHPAQRNESFTLTKFFMLAFYFVCSFVPLVWWIVIFSQHTHIHTHTQTYTNIAQVICPFGLLPNKNYIWSVAVPLSLSFLSYIVFVVWCVHGVWAYDWRKMNYEDVSFLLAISLSALQFSFKTVIFFAQTEEARLCLT